MRYRCATDGFVKPRTFPKDTRPVYGEGELRPKKEPGRPRGGANQRRVNPSIAEVENLLAVLAQLVKTAPHDLQIKARPVLDYWSSLAEAKRAEPQRSIAGRPPSRWVVQLPDKPGVVVTGQKVAAALVGVRVDSLQTMLSRGGGRAHFSRLDANGNPGEAWVERAIESGTEDAS